MARSTLPLNGSAGQYPGSTATKEGGRPKRLAFGLSTMRMIRSVTVRPYAPTQRRRQFDRGHRPHCGHRLHRGHRPRVYPMAWSFKTLAILIGGLATAWATPAASYADEPVLVAFESPHCAPCRAMAMVLSDLESQGVPIRYVDVTREPRMTQRHRVRETPTFVVLRNNVEVSRLSGLQTATSLRHALAETGRGPAVATKSFVPASASLAPIAGHRPAVTRQAAPNGSRKSASPRTADVMPSASVADAVRAAEAATVRLRVHDETGHGVGTGTVIDVQGDEALVLTCGHLFRDTQGKGRIEVDVFHAGQIKTVPGTVIDYDADRRDIALVAIRPGVTITPARLAVASNPAVGTPVFSFGCDHGADPSRRDVRITAVDRYNPQWNASNLEIDNAPVNGRSGGGLFNRAGELVGVCNAADFKSDIGIYAGPGEVRWQLDRIGLTRLYDAPSNSNGNAMIAAASGIAPATAPAVRLASAELPAGSLDVPNQPNEVIVIVRDAEGRDQMRTIRNPSRQLLNAIQQSR